VRIRRIRRIRRGEPILFFKGYGREGSGRA